MMKQAVLLLLIALLGGLTAHAQDTSVYVTTQDYVSLRLGPGQFFERATVVPPGVTLPAYGRSVTNNWLQVEYEGQRGWIAARLLVWSGDWFNLPVDGVEPVPFARRTFTTATTNRETPYYTIYTHDPAANRVGTLPPETTLEITGRFGSSDFIWLQFYQDGQYYWAGAWNFDIEGEPLNLTDAASVYPYGRLIGQVRNGLRNARAPFDAIRSIWRGLDLYGSGSCIEIPRRARVIDFAPGDLDRAPLLAPAARAIQTAIDATNAAITLFEQVCAGGTRTISRETIDQALIQIGEAERAFVIADTLFEPLAERDPLLGGG
jgi:uncharacterized protein YraI